MISKKKATPFKLQNFMHIKLLELLPLVSLCVLSDFPLLVPRNAIFLFAIRVDQYSIYCYCVAFVQNLEKKHNSAAISQQLLIADK